MRYSKHVVVVTLIVVGFGIPLNAQHTHLSHPENGHGPHKAWYRIFMEEYPAEITTISFPAVGSCQE